MVLSLVDFFLVATKRLYKSVCPSVGPSVGPRVTLSLFGLLGATYGRVSGLVSWVTPTFLLLNSFLT